MRIKIKKYSIRHTWMYKMIHSKRQDPKDARLPRVYISPRYMHEEGYIDTNPEDLKSMNHKEPVIEISAPWSYTVIPASRICYNELKRAIDIAKERQEKYQKEE